MSRFIDVKVYTRTLFDSTLKDKQKIFIPYAMAAAALGVEPTTVRAYVGKDYLEGITIESGENSWPGVTLDSLMNEVLAREDRAAKLAQKILPILKKLAGRSINYGDLMSRVDLSWRNPHHRSLTGAALGIVSNKTLKDKKVRVLLSACVVKKQTQLPSDPFFELALGLGVMKKGSDRDKFWRSQMKKIQKAFG